MQRAKKLVSSLLVILLLLLTLPLQSFAQDMDEPTATNESNYHNEQVGPSTNYNVDQVDSFGSWFRNRQEEINPGTGALRLTFTDLVLEGRGLDVVINRTFQSNESNLYRPGTRVESEQYQIWVGDRYGWVTRSRCVSHWHEPVTEQHYHEKVSSWHKHQDTYTYNHQHENTYTHTHYIWHLHDNDYYHNHGSYQETHTEYYNHEHTLVDEYWHEHVTSEAYYHTHVIQEGYDHCHEETYQSWEVVEPGHWETRTRHYLVNTRNTETFIDRAYGIGAGWSFAFPFLEKIGSQIYFHDGNGAVLQVDANSPSRFRERPQLDLTFNNNSGTFSNGVVSSAYLVKQKDGLQTYFAADGRLLGVRDRHGNTITYQHTLRNGVYMVSKIVDTVGREISISYADTQVVITAPGGRTITYNLNATDAGKYHLTSVVDPLGRATTYGYTNSPAAFSFLSKTNREATNLYANLARVTYPGGGQTVYSYEKATGNLGTDGSREYFCISRRHDVASGTELNSVTYAYNGTPDGFPTHTDPANLPANYTFATAVNRPTGETVTYIFNHDSLETVVEAAYPNGDVHRLETAYDANKSPRQINRTVRNSAGATVTTQESFAYDQYGDLLSHTDPQGATTTYTYEPTFHQRTSVQRALDSTGGTARSEFTVNPATGNVTEQRDYYTVDGAEHVARQTFTYDAHGNLTATTRLMVDSSARTTRYEYDGLYGGAYLTRQIEPYTDGAGAVQEAVTQYAYDANTGLVTSIIDPMGEATLTSYDAVGRPTIVTLPAVGGTAATRAFSFDDSALVSTFTDENGHIAQYQYDQLGRMVRVNRYLAGTPHMVRALTYNAAGLLEAETDANGSTTRHEYDGAGRPIRITLPDLSATNIAYDDIQRRQTVTDALGNSVVTLFDVMGREIEVQQKPDPNGATVYRTVQTYDYAGNLTHLTDARGHTTSNAYDELGRRTTLMDALGQRLTYAHDTDGSQLRSTGPDGRITSYAYDASGRLLTETDPLGGVTHYTHDAKGRRTSHTNPAGELTAYAYDARDRLTAMTDPLGHATTYQYDLVGNRIAATDPLGNTTTYAYDDWNRLISRTDPLGAVTSFTYDLAGNQSSTTDPLGNTTTFAYDSLNRMTSTVNALGVTTEWHEYDAAGRRVATTDARDGRTTFAYDGLGRLTRTTNPVDIITTSEFDAVGNLTRAIAGKGNITSYTYDALNRLIAVTDPAGSTWQTTYDALGNTLTVTDPLARVIRNYRYDQMNRAVESIDAMGNATQLVYDSMGRLLQTLQPNGVQVNYTYDAVGRMTGISTSDGIRIGFTFDAAGNRTSRTDAIGTTTYTYDAANQLLTKTTSDGKQLQYTYNPAGQVTGVIDYAGNETLFTHDAAKQVTGATFAGTQTAFYTYDSVGNRTGLTLPGGVTVSYQYDAANRLTNLTNSHSAGVLFSSHIYEYDANNNRIAETDGAGRTAFTYDVRNQLTSVIESDGSNATYAYDAVGNRVGMTDTTGSYSYSYDGADRLTQLTAPNGTYSFTYDANGNQLSDGEREYTYDGLNRLTSVTGPNAVVSYQYDGDHLMVFRQEGAGATQFYHDGGYALNEGDGNGTITASIFRGADLSLGRQVGAGPMAYYLYNGREDVTATLDGAGTVLASYDYDAYGNLVSRTRFDNPYLYAGEYYDYTNQLYYLRARFYSPELGRFLTQDTWKGDPRQPWTQNLYVYTGNNPVNYVDPTGHARMTLIDGGGGGSSCDELAKQDGRSYLNVCNHGRYTAVVVDAFIPAKKFNYGGNEWSGDGRSHTFNEGTSRAIHIALVDRQTGETHVHKYGDLTTNYTRNETGCACGKGLVDQVWQTDSGDVIVGLSANSKDPIARLGPIPLPQFMVPGLRYDLTVSIRKEGSVEVSGAHGFFPAYSVWQRSPGQDPIQLHAYTPEPSRTATDLAWYPWLGGIPVFVWR